MIGPLFRSPRRGPRTSPAETGARRRARNALVDVWEYMFVWLARWERQRLDIVNVDIRIDSLAPAFDGYRIAFVTDLHTSPLVPTWWLNRVVAATNDLAPDLICCGGDFLDDDPHFIYGLADILRPLRAPDGVFGVLGNHDHYVGAAAVRDALCHAGVRELLNTSVMLARGDARLGLCGVGELEMDAIDFEAAVAGVPDDVPRIVLSHDPDVFAYWPDRLRCDLMLCGHTHGGQAWLPLLGPPFVPSQFGFRYLQGRFQDGPRQMYVSRGVGASGVPFRWRSPPELTLVTLRPS